MTEKQYTRLQKESRDSHNTKLTENNNSLFLINPHTSFFFRSEQHIVSEQGLNVYGAVTWGQFFIYQGFNDRLGWMHTSSRADAIDEYLETIVEKDGKPLMAVGTPGGSTIITSVLQTILNVYEFDMGMQQAVNAPRFHHQWLPDHIRFEEGGFSEATLEALRQLGYTIDFGKEPVIGKVDAILFLEDGSLEGGADFRGDDTAIGY